MSALQSLAAQIESATAEEFGGKLKTSRSLINSRISKRNERSEARDGLLQVESEQLRARLAEIDETLAHRPPALLDQARDRRGELQAAAAKLQSDAEYMAQTCLNELGVERPELDGRWHDYCRSHR